MAETPFNTMAWPMEKIQFTGSGRHTADVSICLGTIDFQGRGVRYFVKEVREDCPSDVWDSMLNHAAKNFVESMPETAKDGFYLFLLVDGKLVDDGVCPSIRLAA